MYCYHCGLKIDEFKANKGAANEQFENLQEGAAVEYICPRCGHIIHAGMSAEDAKELSRASHAQIQRGNNNFAKGMCLNALGAILLILAGLFFLIANKPAKGFVLQTNCAEFYVSVVLGAVSVILLGVGIVLTIIGARTKREYNALLKDLNNQTFVQ